MKYRFLFRRFIGTMLSLSIVFLGYVAFTRISDFTSAQDYNAFSLQRPSLEKEELKNFSPEASIASELTLSIPEIQDIFAALPFVEKPALNISDEDLRVSYWIYPGNPACSVLNELKLIESTYRVKPEFATINESGDTVVLTEDQVGCNGLSATNLEKFKEYSDTQFYTVSGSGQGFSELMGDEDKKQASINVLTLLANQTDVDGVEIDFEGFSAWSGQEYTSYLDYLNRLGNSLNETGKKLMIDAPAIYNEGIQSVFQFRYEDFNDIAVDYITIMAYDYQFDYGGGSPVTEDQFLRDSIERAQSELDDNSKLIIGLPTYGYTATRGSYSDIRILTKTQTIDRIGEEGASQATRMEGSQELLYQDGDTVYVFQDQQSIHHKIDIVQEYGINTISIWHLGGNPTL